MRIFSARKISITCVLIINVKRISFIEHLTKFLSFERILMKSKLVEMNKINEEYH